jgi:hypothetical protein
MANTIESTETMAPSVDIERSAIGTDQQPSGSSEPQAIAQGGGESSQGVNPNAVDGRESTVRPRRDKGRGASGPRTVIGKQKSSQSARKHDIFASSLLVKGESKAEFRSMLQGLKEYCHPEGEMENLAVVNIALLEWRRRRVLRADWAEIEKARAFVPVNANTQLWDEDQARVVGIRWNCPNSLTLYRILRHLDELRAKIEARGFDQKEDFPVLVKLYGVGDETIPHGIFRFYVYSMKLAEIHSKGGDPQIGEGVSLEKAKEAMDKYLKEEIKNLEALVPLVKDREIQIQKYDDLRSLVPPQVALDRFLKYEVHFSREIEREQNRLERLQRTRLGQPIPSINVQVSR